MAKQEQDKPAVLFNLGDRVKVHRSGGMPRANCRTPRPSRSGRCPDLPCPGPSQAGAHLQSATTGRAGGMRKAP